MNINPNSPKSHGFFAAKGFYIALALSLAAVGAAAYFVFVSVPSMTAPVSDAADANTAATGETVETVDTAVIPAPQESTPVVPDTEEDSAPASGTVGISVSAAAQQPMEEIEPQIPMLRVAPLEGETIAVFSATQLQYNKTLADWRMHDGIDIAAEEGAHVLAASSGVVESVGRDDMMGMRVILSHEDGYETCYANLGENVFVSEGEYVSAGQVVGTVGTSSLAEAAEGAHLHFGVRRGGVAVDPQEYLGE